MPIELLTPLTNIVVRRPRIVEYPDGDGKPIAETGFHVSQLLHALIVLDFWFRNAENVYVSGNLLFYYEEGNPRRQVAPDVFVVWGVSKEMRRNYKLWEEKQAPQVVIEITSKETQKEDMGKKRALYERIGVAEYYLFDLDGDYLDPPLCGYQLVDQKYTQRPVETFFPPLYGRMAMPMSGAKEGMWSLSSSTICWRLISGRLKLQLWALPTGEPDWPFVLRFYDAAERRWLFDPTQARAEFDQFENPIYENDELLREVRARQAAEAEVTRLKAELEKLRGKA